MQYRTTIMFLGAVVLVELAPVEAAGPPSAPIYTPPYCQVVHDGQGSHQTIASRALFAGPRKADMSDVVPPGWAPRNLSEAWLLSGGPVSSPDYFTKKDDLPLGIESGPLLFIAHHGRPEGLGTHIRISDLKLGDAGLRYAFGCVCQATAHGPAKCNVGKLASRSDYISPEGFSCKSGKCQDSCDMRNVWARWVNALDPDIRMVCFGSSTICGGNRAHLTRPVWEAIKSGRENIANAYLLGLSKSRQSIPLCVAPGGEKAMQSPLFADWIFTADANSWGGPSGEQNERYLHIAYPVWKSRSKSLILASLAGARLPVLRVEPQPPLTTDQRAPLERAQKGENEVQRDPESGSFLSQAAQAEPVESEELSDGFIDAALRRHLQGGQNQADPEVLGQAFITAIQPSFSGDGVVERWAYTKTSAMRIDIARVEGPESIGSSHDDWVAKGNAYFERVFDVSIGPEPSGDGRLAVPGIGDGGFVRFEVAPPGATGDWISAIEFAARRVTGVVKRCAVRGDSKLQAERMLAISTEGTSCADAYEEDEAFREFGYRERGWWEHQETLTPYFYFRFVPRDWDRLAECEPLDFEVPAFLEDCWRDSEP